MKKIFEFILWSILSIIGFNVFLYYTEIVPPSLTSFKEGFGLYPKSNLDYIRIKEGLFIGTTGSDGRFGDRYTPDNKPEGIFRIGLVGDSYVQGTDVMTSMHFRKIMEDKLNEGHTNKRYEVVNLGRNNFNIPYSYHYYKNFGINYKLDHVLYFMEERDFNAESLNKLSTYYEAKDGKLVENQEWKNTGMYNLLEPLEKHSVLKHYSSVPMFNLINRAKSNIRIRGAKYLLLGKFSSLDLLLNRKEENFSHHDPEYWSGKTENTAELSEVTKLIIDELVKSEEPKITIVTRNYPVKVNRLERYLEAQGAEIFPLSEIFDGDMIRGTDINANLFKATNLYGGHFNHLGHKALGEFLARKVLEKFENNK